LGLELVNVETGVVKRLVYDEGVSRVTVIRIIE